MDILRNNHPIRDFCLAILLILLIKPALYLSKHRVEKEYIQQKSFIVHELNQKILDSIETTKKQLNQTISLAKNNDLTDSIEHLENLSNTLTTVENKYIKNSPGLLFLGPIASFSIILKEKTIEKQLKKITIELNKILCELSQREINIDIESNTIISNLKRNFILLKEYSNS